MITTTFARHPLLSVLAVIGVIALLALAGMSLMHAMMMGGFSSMSEMWSACQTMMSAQR
jgi:hypothetical protein